MASPISEEQPPQFDLIIDPRTPITLDNIENPLASAMLMSQLLHRWAHFHLYIISPHINTITPPILIHPETLENGDQEYVYVIHDMGDRLYTSKGQEMFSAGMSMCKLFYTIEKMIFLLVERLKTGGIDTETEVQVAFGGYILAQRKAFESIINLVYNVVVTNFDPGAWGEHYLQTVRRIADQGYGYPSEGPREPYRKLHGGNTKFGRNR